MFFPRSEGAVFLFRIAQAFFPAAEHLADLLQLYRYTLALLVGDNLAFPCNGDQKLECVGYENAFRDFLPFLFPFREICGVGEFQKIKKFIFNPGTERVTRSLRNMRHKIHPKQISLFDPRENRGVTERETIVRPRHDYQDIISVENLLSAWREFLRGKRKRKDVAIFSLNLVGNILALHRELSDKTYCHGPYHAFKINDPKPRDIHKAEVRDRLLHHAIYRILYPYFDRTFIFDSYSCRFDKGTYRAMDRFKKYAGIVSRNHTRTAWVLKCDIKKFFASIDHETLKGILGRHIEDNDILWLLSEVIDSFHTKDKPGVGLPLGNLTSQLRGCA